jgi:hypothetical protein
MFIFYKNCSFLIPKNDASINKYFFKGTTQMLLINIFSYLKGSKK